jgi:hypothetical protein
LAAHGKKYTVTKNLITNFLMMSIAKFYKKRAGHRQPAQLEYRPCHFYKLSRASWTSDIYNNTKNKEIGVRKVLGASVSQIVSLLSRDFLGLVCWLFAIAAPLAWWAMNKWLQDFAYRTTFSWWIFAISGALMLIVALMTLSIQTIRSAVANPVNSLRTE